MIPIVHAVTDDTVLADAPFVERAVRVMLALGERGALHLRGKSVTSARMFELATRLAEVQNATGCMLVLNDRLDIALASGARAVQLTSRSMRVADVRFALDACGASMMIGASVHAVAEARTAEREGAAWVVAGHVFATASHPGVAPQGLDFLRRIASSVALPCIAIGGVTPERVATLLDAGAAGVAAIGGIWGEGDAERAAIDYLSAHDAAVDAARAADGRRAE
jgi:thiamine-phosphate diphosphorylase